VALRGGARWRTLLDGTLVAAALFLVSWATALGSAIRGGSGSALGYFVSVAYPGCDLILLTVTVVVAEHARHTTSSGLAVLATGLASLCIADSGFAYLTATGRYHTGSLVDAGWVAGFVLIAVAASSRPAHCDQEAQDTVVAAGKTLLPYVPAGVGLATGLISTLAGRGSVVTLAAATVVVVALLGRQLIAIFDNRRLVRDLLTVQQELHHQAFHDALTGLANRALFNDRLRHGLELHRRDLRPLTLVFCDLDGFKKVNDTLGHDAGDGVLKAAAERLQAVTRRGDTLARLGGDEFAILVEDGGDVDILASRILDGFARPVNIDIHTVPVGVSIGIAILDAECSSISPTDMLRRADSAMYAAKRSGKGTASKWCSNTTEAPSPYGSTPTPA
jgi:diguanylate cyclase (GGDEF)-like protein